MKYIGTKEIEISKIKSCRFPARTEKEEKEDIENLTKSTKKYLINPISVRIINNSNILSKDDEYEIMAGERRLQSFINNDIEKIEAKIYDDVSDLDAMMFTFKENVQRKNININDRDRYIYNMWIVGKWDEKTKTGFKYIKDLAREIEMNENTVREIISAGEEKAKFNSIVIQSATTRDLIRTKSLVEHPDLREKLLEKEQKKEINTEEMEIMSKKIKESIDEGLDKDVIKNVIDITSKDKKESNYFMQYEKNARVDQGTPGVVYGDLNKNKLNKNNTNKNESNMITPEKFGDVLDVIKKSPIDIQEKLAKGKITTEDAKTINKFETKGQREIAEKEIKYREHIKAKNIEKVEAKTKEKIDDLQSKAQKLKENPDIVFDNRRNISTPEEHDKVYMDEFSSITRDTSDFNSRLKIKNIKTDLGKEHAIKCSMMNYNIWRTVLINAGVIIKSDVIKTDFKVVETVDDVNNLVVKI